MALEHGTTYAYNSGCRCRDCRNAEAWYRRAKLKANREKGLPSDDPRHGTDGGYNYWSCRCMECTEAHRRYRRRERKDSE